MANSYQLVAWTDKGQVRMIPSEVTAYLHAEMAVIDRMADKIRYLTVYERSDIFRVSQSYEKLAVRMMDLGRTEDAFELYVQAAQCCLSSNEWQHTEWGEILCKPLRGRFFAMYCACKDLARKYPKLKYNWDESGLRDSLNSVTYAFDCFENEWNASSGDPKEAQAYSRALNFGKNEVYCRRRA